MNLTIDKTELQRGLVRIQSIVEKRNTMPILANVLLEAAGGEDGSLELAATDLEVTIRGSHPANVTKAGGVTVSAKKLYEIVRELPDEPVTLEVADGAFLTVRCARSRFQLTGTASEEYPELPDLSADKTIKMPALVLSQMIERTIYSASQDETRYNLNGVYLEYLEDSGKLRMVATDGHRLAYADRALGTEFEALKSGVIIPRKGLAELKRLVDDEDADEVEISLEGSSGLARSGSVTLGMRLIEGEFPNYHQVIPRETNHRVTVAAELLIQALRRVALLSAERSRAVTVELTAGNLVLSSSNPDLGDAREELDVDYDGEELAVAFNARYLLDALSVARAKEITIGFQDPLSPAELRPTDDPDTLAVVMPMRI